ncbi:MAG: hypothetical protein M3072_17745 [Candidatus Dormibacteraeota bacterium]|nr:hypothetical protein [Candidatus Dormibacteraeota bacterium]
MVERVLDSFQRRLHPAQGPSVTVPQRVQRPLQLDTGAFANVLFTTSSAFAVV